jgi:hypothetical protein
MAKVQAYDKDNRPPSYYNADNSVGSTTRYKLSSSDNIDQRWIHDASITDWTNVNNNDDNDPDLNTTESPFDKVGVSEKMYADVIGNPSTQGRIVEDAEREDTSPESIIILEDLGNYTLKMRGDNTTTSRLTESGGNTYSLDQDLDRRSKDRLEDFDADGTFSRKLNQGNFDSTHQSNYSKNSEWSPATSSLERGASFADAIPADKGYKVGGGTF